MPKSKAKKPKAGNVFTTYLRYTRQHPWLLVAVVLGLLMVQASALLYPLFLRQFFNVLAAGHPSAETAQVLFVTLMFVAGMWFMDWLGRRVHDPAVSYLESSVMKRLSADAFQYLLGHSYNFFISTFAGSLTHKVSKYSRA